MIRIIDDTKCFECGVGENIHQHHVVPKVKGGTMTLPLCQVCHSKVHGDHMLKMQKLAWITRKKKIEEFRKLGIPSSMGRPSGSFEDEQKFLNKPRIKEIIECLNKKMTYKQIVKSLNVSHSTIKKAKRIAINNNHFHNFNKKGRV